MFPADVQTYLENEDAAIQENETLIFNGSSFLYDFKKGDFIYNNGNPIAVKGRVALEIWIEKVIRTEKFRFKIHEEIEYGVLIEDLIGSMLPRGFIESEIRRELTEAILRNPFIEELIDWSFEVDSGEWIVGFTVISVEGSFEMEVVS